jgi:hypothetical protein
LNQRGKKEVRPPAKYKRIKGDQEVRKVEACGALTKGWEA